MLGSKTLGERTGKPDRCEISSLPEGEFISQQQLPGAGALGRCGAGSLSGLSVPRRSHCSGSSRGWGQTAPDSVHAGLELGQLRPERRALPTAPPSPPAGPQGWTQTSHPDPLRGDPGGQSTRWRGGQASPLPPALSGGCGARWPGPGMRFAPGLPRTARPAGPAQHQRI